MEQEKEWLGERKRLNRGFSWANNNIRYSEEEDEIIVDRFVQHSEAEWDEMSMHEQWEPLMENVCNRLS